MTRPRSRRRWATTCRRPPSRCSPELRRTLRAGLAAGALAGLVSGSGPTVALLCADAESAGATLAAELAGSGTCRTVRIASGPAPGRPGSVGRPTRGVPHASATRGSQPYGRTSSTSSAAEPSPHGVRTRPGPGVARRADRRPDRRPRAQRLRQDHPAAAPRRAASARTPGGCPPRAAPRIGVRHAELRPAARRRPSGTSCCTPSATREHAWAVGQRGPRRARPGSACATSGWTPLRRQPVRRRAAPGRAGRRAGHRRRPAAAGRADQPSRHRGASPGWPTTCGPGAARWSPSPTTAGSSTRVATTTWEVVDGAVLGPRGRLLGLGFRPGRAAAAGPGGRGTAAEPGPQGAGLAAPRPAGPHVQAAVPDRGGRGAHRRRAGAAEHRGAARVRPPPARQGRARTRGRHRHRDGRRPARERIAARRRHLAGRPGRPDRRRRGQRLRQVDAAADAGRATGRRTAGRSKIGSTVRLGYLSQEVAELPGELRVLEAVTRDRRDRSNLGGKQSDRGSAGRAVRLHQRPTSGPGWPSCPAASAAGCSCCGC